MRLTFLIFSLFILQGCNLIKLMIEGKSVVSSNFFKNPNQITITCPENYVYVAANSTLGVNHFCVMQFEAKDDGSGNAVSQPTNTPWVLITHDDAKTKCTNIGSKYDLISNAEWMTIAHEIELNQNNWSSGIVGNGMIARGNSDGSPGTFLAVSNTSNFYDGTDNSAGDTVGLGWEQKRIHYLANNQIIWDFAGNVWEIVDWSLGGALTLGPTSCASAWEETYSSSCGALSAAEYMPVNSTSEANFGSTFGLGMIYGGTQGGAWRSGNSTVGANAGIYTLYLNSDPSSSSSSTGFRCVYRP